jgi:hypothetical protein
VILQDMVMQVRVAPQDYLNLVIQNIHFDQDLFTLRRILLYIDEVFALVEDEVNQKLSELFSKKLFDKVGEATGPTDFGLRM